MALPGPEVGLKGEGLMFGACVTGVFSAVYLLGSWAELVMQAWVARQSTAGHAVCPWKSKQCRIGPDEEPQVFFGLSALRHQLSETCCLGREQGGGGYIRGTDGWRLDRDQGVRHSAATASYRKGGGDGHTIHKQARSRGVVICGTPTVTPQIQLPSGLRHTRLLLKDTTEIFPGLSFSSLQHAACMDGPVQRSGRMGAFITLQVCSSLAMSQ